jgi:amino acid adenylation domain-containing protein
MAGPTLSDYLTGSAARRPHARALIDGDFELSYSELATAAGEVAARLAKIGVAPGDRVLWHGAKSAEAIVAVHGILAAGGAYVPIDPASPAARWSLVARNSRPSAVIADAAALDRWRAHRPQLSWQPLAGLTGLRGRQMWTARCDEDPTSGDPGTPDLAYILHTSGSTGRPKGVAHRHASARAFVDWAVPALGITADDVLTSIAPLHFDLSTFDLFAAAEAGAAVVVVPDRMTFPSAYAGVVARHRATIWYSVPSLLAMLVERGSSHLAEMRSLRTLLFAGEVLAPKHLQTLMTALPHTQFVNLYGPTETNVCTWHQVWPHRPVDDPIPIGRPVDGDWAEVVDSDGRALPAGVPGELLIGGATLMSGYWNDPAGTRDKTVVRDRGLAYRTGDLVVEHADGELRYLGRLDNQVKSRGYRIELEEVERTLATLPQVRECVVTAVPDPLVTNVLHAFVVPVGECTTGELVELCATKLPAYMIPEKLIQLPDLPRLSNGKVDRTALRNQARLGVVP